MHSRTVALAIAGAMTACMPRMGVNVVGDHIEIDTSHRDVDRMLGIESHDLRARNCRSKYRPHQGAQEKARRVRQMGFDHTDDSDMAA